MKKIIFLCLVLLGIVGCTQMPVIEREPIVSITKESKIATFKVTDLGRNTIYGTLKNETGDVVEIVWKDSSLNNSRVFINGQKYLEASTPMSNTIMAPFSTVDVAISQADQVHYVSGYGWDINNLKYPSNLVLKIKQNSKEEYSIFNIDAKVTEKTK
ncbi:hypothetical protein VSU16_04585 [Cetobacterium somerae]|uniref:hypothetical protein n=1 Tax=Cetobacterium somerae TaxID=188913 RepID=UPI002E7B54E0|nr:hypothetical protein [Cetobacterium somerae]WVJ02021.1 hypothetical protein VSU16_04585 [Cetobacterium somerae]